MSVGFSVVGSFGEQDHGPGNAAPGGLTNHNTASEPKLLPLVPPRLQEKALKMGACYFGGQRLSYGQRIQAGSL